MNIGILLALVIIVLAGAFLVSRLRRGRPMASARRPRKRHIVIRVICGLLGATILVAIAVGTRQEVLRCYAADELGESLKVHVPTQPAPALPAPAGQHGQTEIEEARLLLHIVLADVAAGTARPLHAREYKIQWPRDKGRSFQGEAELDGLEVEYTFAIEKLYAWRKTPDEAVILNGDGVFSLRYDAAGRGRGTRSGSFRYADAVLVGAIGASRPPWKQPLSITDGPQRHLRVFCLMTFLEQDDLMGQISLNEFVRLRLPALQRALRDRQDDAGLSSASRYRMDLPIPGLALAGHIGLSSLLLLVAAVLFTQLFARRSMAFVGVLTALVLYIIVLDRLVLETHLSHLRDTNAPLDTRMVACAQTADTFFFRHTALRRAQTIRQDPAAPERLRDVAAEVTRVLLRPAVSNVSPPP